MTLCHHAHRTVSLHTHLIASHNPTHTPSIAQFSIYRIQYPVACCYRCFVDVFAPLWDPLYYSIYVIFNNGPTDPRRVQISVRSRHSQQQPDRRLRFNRDDARHYSHNCSIFYASSSDATPLWSTRTSYPNSRHQLGTRATLYDPIMRNAPGHPSTEPIPLVIVQGFLSAGSWIWGNFEKYLNKGCKHPRRTIFVSIGPVSSLHDRACELYYALVGGTVDYGEQHAAQHGHARFGRTIAHGLYPEWSSEAPLHFLGHSVGGPTLVKLTWLIRNGHFGPNADPRMVLSLSAVTAPFRGTSLVYSLGERVDAAPAVGPLSVGAFIGKIVHILSFIAPFLPKALDMHGDARSLTYRDISFGALLRQLWRSDWAESRDATPFDVTFQAAEEREQEGEGRAEAVTFYQSFVATTTEPSHNKSSSLHTPPLRLAASPFIYASSRKIGAFDYATLRPTPRFLCREGKLGQEFYANDGVVPLFSQWHPFSCSETRCSHTPEVTVRPGVWYVTEEADAHHLTIMPWWTGTRLQREFWAKLSRWLAVVDSRAASR